MTAAHGRVDSRQEGLAATLLPRHVGMIGFGGTIGLGIFVNSGQIISTAGPGAVVSYLVAALLAVVVMSMLRSMSIADPTTGSFAAYARRAFGSVGGFTIGWLYWWLLVVTIGVECTAATKILNQWEPAVPQWIWIVAIMIVFTGLNLLPVRAYAETQFWLGSIKVVVLAAIVIAGVLALFGLIPSVHSPGLSNLTNLGGLLPHGLSPVLTGLLGGVFAFFGIEMVTIASGEAAAPRRTIYSTLRNVTTTIAVLYIGMMVVSVTLEPWNSPKIASGPAAALMTLLKLPYAGTIMGILVCATVLSTLSSSLYAGARMAYYLAGQGDAPRTMGNTSRVGVPVGAIVVTAVIGFATVIVQYVAPTGVFLVMANSVGAVGMLVWLAIAVSYARLRPSLRRPGHPPPVSPRRGLSLLSLLVVAIIVIMLVGMGFVPDTQSQVFATVGAALIILIVALWRDTI